MKYIFKQKRKFLLYCVVIILSNLPLYAQLTERVITVTHSPMDIPGLAKTIAAQTGVEYSLNMQNTSLKKYVHLKPGKWKLEDVMKEVQEQVGLNYKILGDHILFTDYKPVKKTDSVKVVTSVKKAELVKPAKRAEPVKHVKKGEPVKPAKRSELATPVKKAEPVKPAKKAEQEKPAKKTAQVTPVKNTALVKPVAKQPDNLLIAPAAIESYTLTPLRADYAITPPAVKVKPGHVTTRELKDKGTSSTTAIASRERRHIDLPEWLSPLAEAGVTANDIVYISASVKAGIQYLYGIGTLGVTSRGMRFRYGAGIRVPLNEYTALHAEFTTGALSRRGIDSFPQKGKIYERLNSFGLSWSKTIRPRLNLQLEVNYSTLKKSNDSTVNKVNVGTNYYGYGTPLYKIMSSTNGKDAAQNTWIGARISLFYNLRRR